MSGFGATFEVSKAFSNQKYGTFTSLLLVIKSLRGLGYTKAATSPNCPFPGFWVEGDGDAHPTLIYPIATGIYVSGAWTVRSI